MRYLVQYAVAEERRIAEIEATSPHEAVVKFRHIRRDCAMAPIRSTEILSVSPEPICDDLV